MNLTLVGSNQTEIEVNNDRVFFSYKTPVAAIIDGQAYRTDCRWSPTTSKHLNAWLDGRNAISKEQSFFDNLLTVNLNKAEPIAA